MDCRISLTANAGVIIDSDIRFTIDALHNIRSKVFPSLSPEMTGEVFRLLDERPPHAMLITHEHIDHYSRALTADARRRYPNAAVIFPASIKAGSGKYRGDGYQASWRPLPHSHVDGFEDVANYAFLMEFNGHCIFTAGDADPTAPQTAEYVNGLCPDLAILNFTWVARRGSRETLEKLGAKHLVIVHLPFPDADPYGYNAATALAVREYQPGAIILNRFLQSAELIL